ncbi:MAG: arginine deiminase-related protein [Flavobacteriaceae bacterium]|nr:arginine deiminase-related protein [Flavobacteriaceae bacterium]
MTQITSTLLMIRPAVFRMNEETAVNNYFQEGLKAGPLEITHRAQAEFDAMVGLLRGKGVEVIVVQDEAKFDTPDSVFPNNWVSFHQDGQAVLYPMFAKNRRRERRESVLEKVEEQGFTISNVMDYTSAEDVEVYLEGTGSMILDRVNGKAYCALSSRADEDLFIEFCEDFEMDPVLFYAFQDVGKQRLPIYHTNVLMCLGERFCVICLEAIDAPSERKNLLRHLRESKKEVIVISEAQMHQFAGNMLQVIGANDQRYIVMSASAKNALTEDQIAALSGHGFILDCDLTTIETCGGGSARCMMAEVFLPKG